MTDFTPAPVPWQQDSGSDVVRIPAVKKRLWMALATFLVLTLMMVLPLVLSPVGADTVPAAIVTTIFGALATMSAVSLYRTRFALELGPNGVRLANGRLIEWANMAALEIHEAKNGSGIRVRLVDPERYLKDLGSGAMVAMTRRMLKSSRSATGYDLVISNALTDLNALQLAHEMANVATENGHRLNFRGLTGLSSRPTPPPIMTADEPSAIEPDEGQWPQLPPGNLGSRDEGQLPG